MKKIIVENEYYALSVDEEKNRIYYKISGYWADISKVSSYLSDIAEVLKHVKPNFTMLVDNTEAEPHPLEIEELRKQAQKLANEAQLLVAAEIIPFDKISAMQFQEMTTITNFKFSRFKTFEEAEKWLDEKTIRTDN